VLTCSCTASSGYWSSSSFIGNAVSAWSVYFFDGGAGALNKGNHYHVRAVRGG
jgi:hypothetical protein